MSTRHRTLVYAHRGANKEAAENTRAAFDRALAYAIDGIETDVQLSRDEVAVLWHDRHLGKLGLPGKRIDDFDYSDLRAMDFASHFAGPNGHGNKSTPNDETRHARSLTLPSPRGRGGDGSPREFHANKTKGVMGLSEFLAAYRTRCRLLLEIKNREWEQPARRREKVRQTLALAGDVEDKRIQVSSFDLASMIHAHQIAPGFPLILNLEPEHDASFARGILTRHPFLHGLCVDISTLWEDMVRTVREHGKQLAVYTCNSSEEISRALDLGVDILISDVPQTALEMRNGIDPPENVQYPRPGL